MGLIARGIEEAGLPTVFLGSCLDMMTQLMAPRTAFLDFPLGRQCGSPGNRLQQIGILKASLSLFETAEAPGEIRVLPFEWHRPFSWESYSNDVADMIREEGIPPQDWKKDG